ncbi:hypothetical protein CO038_03085 [Candidatus Pacearchaeota archaeon CG_4_9_14_0_2_um_filter_39_13]|nr:hypothetical protein [Candidatus Pacearchaeota archaeon]OIO42146.1 MAG: hypothetical protein AUJ64_04220 [Candidatus Pacearchaeota archaeon CG1_02_39_14]PJC44551.1 MAG: hypothetical protein CO038_03085 [Candidatus Pacearchaeota archaeon CG_4_9_14_0_2_um_filter_39_13]
MKKRGQASGLSWFVAIPILAILLFIFFAATFYLAGTKEIFGNGNEISSADYGSNLELQRDLIVFLNSGMADRIEKWGADGSFEDLIENELKEYMDLNDYECYISRVESSSREIEVIDLEGRGGLVYSRVNMESLLDSRGAGFNLPGARIEIYGGGCYE